MERVENAPEVGIFWKIWGAIARRLPYMGDIFPQPWCGEKGKFFVCSALLPARSPYMGDRRAPNARNGWRRCQGFHTLSALFHNFSPSIHSLAVYIRSLTVLPPAGQKARAATVTVHPVHLVVSASEGRGLHSFGAPLCRERCCIICEATNSGAPHRGKRSLPLVIAGVAWGKQSSFLPGGCFAACGDWQQGRR